MVKVNINQSIQPNIKTGYNLCFIGSPTADKEENEFKIYTSVVTQSQVDDAFGSNSTISKMYKDFLKVDKGAEIELDLIKIPHIEDSSPTRKDVTFSLAPDILGFKSEDIFTVLLTLTNDETTKANLTNMETNIDTYFDKTGLANALLNLSKTAPHNNNTYTFNVSDLLSILGENCYDGTSISQLQVMTANQSTLFTATTAEITGVLTPIPTPEEDYTVTIKLNNQIIEALVQVPATLAQMVSTLATVINNNANTGFRAEGNGGSLTLTALSLSSSFDEIEPEFNFGDITNYLYTTTTQKAVVNNPLDDLPSFLDTIKKKERLFVVEDGIDLTPLINKLGDYQTIRNRDLMGRLLIVEFDTYSNLMIKSKAINKKYVTFFGIQKDAVVYKDTGEFITKSCLSACLAGKLGVAYTNGADASSVFRTHPIGNINNQKYPLDGSAFDFLTVLDGKDFADPEIDNLTDNGVWTAYKNDANNLAVGNYTTTLYLTDKGEPTEIFRRGNTDEATSTAISYIFQFLKIKADEKAINQYTMSELKSMFDTCYRVLANEVNDPISGFQYDILDIRGIDIFMDAIIKNGVIDTLHGIATFEQVPLTVYSQLEKIILNVFTAFYTE